MANVFKRNRIVCLTVGLLIVLLIFFLAFRFAIWGVSYSHAGVHWSLNCDSSLRGLGKAILIYVNDHNDYPTPEKWCDILMEEDPYLPGYRCKGAGKGRCHYAMNPNCEPNSPNDVVLLFETKAGWNQFGGPDILTFDNHKGKGCNVLLKDLHTVRFIKPEELGTLKWKNK